LAVIAGYLPPDCLLSYDNTIQLNTGASVSWSVVNNNKDISMQMKASTNGWLSFGLDTGNGMCNSEDVIGWLNNTNLIASAYIVPCDHRSDDTR
jgi:hypothetical protein